MARVLVVDDDDDVRESVCGVLESAGYETESAGDGLQALDVLAHVPGIDCMVLDMHMPRLDGTGVLDALTDDHLSVLVLSAFEYVSEVEVNRRYAERVCAFLVKPVFPRILLQTVERCLQGS